ncbi:hypothetical protein BCR33DRAFT_715639 [Rhizoclosmatium globosum]|uniref:ADP/ATP translocase n=1 Tax=Rhizoclosmatium globosum TaxID=329046 RepID=A0A1Y2CHR7_9FUNG|nr:hypothetical protein BCR33DRAFT_715639 [Rhizoclosmatium globosum]|eukprot:ORY46593.1 hypothetical protein BCR33DRAFT_715639 [Rhizoclosmatium globosum]
MDSQAQDTVFSAFATSFASGSIAGIRVRLNEAIGAKKGPGFFWKGSLSSSIRYFPPQGMNLASKDLFHFLLPNYDPRTQFGSFLGVNLAAGGAAVLWNFIAGIITYRGIQFGLNDTLKGVNPWDKETSLAGLASKWTIAQFSTYLATIFTNPFDIARRSLSLEVEGRKQVHTGVTDSLKKIVQRDGILSLFKERL